MVFYLVMIHRKGGCSMFGANATATPDGGLLQLRALDWNVDGRIKVLTHACTRDSGTVYISG